MSKIDFVELFTGTQMSATAMNSIRQLQTYNMFNTQQTIWFDRETNVMYYEACIPNFPF